MVLADSTFYICLLDDICRPEILARVSKSCRLLVGRLAMREISRRRYRAKPDGDVLESAVRPYDAALAFTMLFGRGQVTKGEYEVIALAYSMHLDGQPFVLIMDDADGRKMVRRRFAHLADFMTGTVGFVVRCHTHYSILVKDEALGVLRAIRASKFRVAGKVIDSAMEEVQRH